MEVRIKIEFIDNCSEGMNGYLALCGGDRQHSCFSSPIEGDGRCISQSSDVSSFIKNFGVVIFRPPELYQINTFLYSCAIYKLPDDLRGSDIARPPPGVVLPKKV